MLHDVLGIKGGFAPKFVKQYANLDISIREAVQSYRDDVLSLSFPGEEHSFTIADKELAKLEATLKDPGQ